MNQLPAEILTAIRRALDEDIGTGDATTNSIVPPDAMMQGQIIAKQEGVIAGLDIVRATFAMLDESIECVSHADEGQRVGRGRELVSLSGRARPLLTGERTALNLLGRMSGIATLTRKFVEAVAGTNAIILDTRKTVPGLRLLDKLAVKRGGGENHRMGLYDMILIKDNHIDFAGGMEEAVRRARASHTGLQIEVEARSIQDVKVALSLNVERILLDNMSVRMISECVETTKGRAKLEASGNVSLETVRQIAETGVDFISVGALTHSASVLDVSLDWSK